jgi:hypothetical protein
VLPFFPEIQTEKVLTISLWTEKKYAEVYEREWFPKVEEILKPYLTTRSRSSTTWSRLHSVSTLRRRW